MGRRRASQPLRAARADRSRRRAAFAAETRGALSRGGAEFIGPPARTAWPPRSRTEARAAARDGASARLGELGRGMAPLGDSDVEIGFVGRLSVLPVVFFLGRRHGKSLASSRGRRLRPHDRLARALVRHREPAAYRAELQAAVAVARLV